MNSSDESSIWQPSATQAVLQYRASLLQAIRLFFYARKVLEVETPILAAAGVTDPNIDSFTTQYMSPGHAKPVELYLQTSPEYAMKRLLAAGSGAIFQIGKVFRQGESGTLHNPEFTLLEWYRPGFDRFDLIKEIDELIRSLDKGTTEFSATEYFTYSTVFERYVGIDPLAAPPHTLIQCAKDNGIDAHGLDPQNKDEWLDLLMSHCIQPKLEKNKPIFITDFPLSQGALALVCDEDQRLAQRFECYIDGIEIANGYHELTDRAEHLLRFNKNKQARKMMRKTDISVDTKLLDAIEAGIPQCAGVALGIDRLLMVLLGEKNIENVLAFPVNRA